MGRMLFHNTSAVTGKAWLLGPSRWHCLIEGTWNMPLSARSGELSRFIGKEAAPPNCLFLCHVRVRGDKYHLHKPGSLINCCQQCHSIVALIIHSSLLSPPSHCASPPCLWTAVELFLDMNLMLYQKNSRPVFRNSSTERQEGHLEQYFPTLAA